MEIKLAIFDLAGTIVDFGCLAVKNGFKDFFTKNNIEASDETITKYTGVSKREHLELILNDPQCNHNLNLNDNAIGTLYSKFKPILLDHIKQNSVLIDGVLDLYEKLKSNNIKIATTTGYFQEAANIVVKSIHKQGFKPHFSICDDNVAEGRPAPWMIFECMKATNVQSVHKVVKIGDTVVDIQAGRNAGVFTIGVMNSSSIIGMSKKEFYSLNERDRRYYRSLVADKLISARANSVVQQTNPHLLSVMY